jgi:hypothetical protein
MSETDDLGKLDRNYQIAIAFGILGELHLHTCLEPWSSGWPTPVGHRGSPDRAAAQTRTSAWATGDVDAGAAGPGARAPLASQPWLRPSGLGLGRRLTGLPEGEAAEGPRGEEHKTTGGGATGVEASREVAGQGLERLRHMDSMLGCFGP